ncbi:MAG: ATP-binding protein [Acidaminobacteraceae bacterium]
MIFYALDKEWNFTLSDGRGLTTIGLEPGQVLGVNAKEMYHNNPDIIEAIEEAFKGKEKGKISIKLEHENKKIKVSFTDDGCGMSASTLSKIYEPFFTTRRDLGGTGLGLSVVYSIVTQQFLGTIICSSELGVGTTFTMILT